MVRKLFLIVPLVFSSMTVNSSFAQPRQEVGPWETMVQVGETLQSRQDLAPDQVVEVQGSSGSGIVNPFSPAGASTRTVAVTYFGSVAPNSASTGRPVRVTPYQPLVLGSLFNTGNQSSYLLDHHIRTLPPLEVEPKAPQPIQVAPTPAPAVVSAPQAEVPPPPRPPVQPARDLGQTVDAFLNFSEGPYPAAHTLAEGSPTSWYESPVVTEILGRTPNESEKEQFKSDILTKVEQSFQKSGLDIDLSADAGPASHTLSVVSGATAVDNPEAIGIADIGGDGFTFLDNFNPDFIDTFGELKTAVANNISHELMHAFGVDFHDEAGDTIDSGRIAWNNLTSDDLSFSQDAVSLLESADFQKRWDMQLASHQLASHGQGCSCHQFADSFATPEPTTIALWGIGLSGLVMIRRSRNRK